MAENKKTTTKKTAKKAEASHKGVSSSRGTKVPASSGKVECNDRLCPIHGNKKLKMRGRTFEGIVTKKLHGRVTIEFERMLKLPKYERYEKRKTKIHARLPECMKNDANVGDLIQNY